MSSINIRRAKRVFNTVAKGLIDQMIVLFDGDQTLMFLRNEMVRLGGDKTHRTDHVPAGNFFNAMNTETTIKREGGSGSGVGAALVPGNLVVGELVLMKDDRIFGPEIGVTIPIVKALGLVDKWPRLSPENKAIVWDYFGRMASTSAQVVLGMYLEKNSDMREIASVIMKKNSKLQAGASEEQVGQFVEEALKTFAPMMKKI